MEVNKGWTFVEAILCNLCAKMTLKICFILWRESLLCWVRQLEGGCGAICPSSLVHVGFSSVDLQQLTLRVFILCTDVLLWT